MNYSNLLILLSFISGITFFTSLVIIPFLIINLSPDYFRGKRKTLYQYKNPIARYFILTLKNMIGYILIILGIIMLFIPGQGLLSITIGILLINFPGKKRLEYKFFTNKKVSGAINAIRRKAGKEEINFSNEPS